MPAPLWWIIAALTVVPAAAYPTAQISGSVQDSSGAMVPEVMVSAFNEQTGTLRHTRTGPQGLYVLAALEPGRYKVWVRKDGFQTVARLGVRLEGNRHLRLDFALSLGRVEQVIVIEGDAPVMQTADASVGTLIGPRLIHDLPLNGRGLLGLLELAPGVLVTPASEGEAGQFSVSGQRPNTNYFTVDGVGANTGVSGAGLPSQFPGGTLPAMTAFGGLHNVASLESVQEVRIQTSNFAAEFGRMQGGQIALTTRSGSNAVHGSLFHLLRNERLGANDWFANSYGLPRAAQRLNHAGGALGAPIRKNRTFAFLSLERMRLVQPYVWRTPVPSVAARRAASPWLEPLLSAYPLPNGRPLAGGMAEFTGSASLPAQLDFGSLRIDHALTSRVTLFARFTRAPSSTRSGYSQVLNSSFADRSLTFGVSANLRPDTINDFRLNLTAARVGGAWTSTGLGGALGLDLSPLFPATSVSFYSLSIGGLGRLMVGDSGRNEQRQFNMVDSVSLTRGSHQVRLGGDYLRLRPTREGAASSLALTFPSVFDLLSNQVYWLAYTESRESSSRLHSMSLFAQDTWQAAPRLTLNYGLRWEWSPAPRAGQAAALYSLEGEDVHEVDAGTSLWRTRLANFAPRLGMAYRLSANGRSVLRAGAGLFYDLGFSAATDELNGAPYNSWQLAGGDTYASRAAVALPLLAFGFSNDLRLPYSLQWNVALQHTFTEKSVATVSYVGSGGRHLLRREAVLWPRFDLAQLAVATNHGASNYRALQVQFRQRAAGGLQGLLSYTWSRSTDTGSWDSSLYLTGPGITAGRDRGPSNFDATHGFAAGFSYDFPSLRRMRAITRGWSFDGMARARSGFPIDVQAAETLAGLTFANVIRPSLIPGAPVWMRDPASPGGRRLNLEAFTLPAESLQGDLARNSIRGFGMSQVDVSLRRQIRLGGRASAQFRVNAFNVFNHASLADPERYLSSPLFGRSGSMLNVMLGSGSPRSGLTPAFQPGGPRVVEIGARFQF